MSTALDFIRVASGDITGTNFSSQLLRLIFKADMMNRKKLEQVFPVHVKLHKWWLDSDPEPTDQQIHEFVKNQESLWK
ncbi:hypothetical protein LCGC14_1035910 [marine sediment metagenome]|uniref:Uncharacterized protein n=1 Tax=marine sediment metagenome TaxID=412755 RepID=A0A0F9QBF6_9ZZZZ